MLRLGWRTARATAGRLVAAGLAIALGTAFATAVLLADDLMQRTIFAAVSSSYAGADVVVSPGGRALRPADLARVRALPGVAGADGRQQTGVELLGHREEFAEVTGAPSVPALRRAVAHQLTAGHLPTGPAQVALPADVAERLGARRGGTLRVQVTTAVDDGSGPGADDQPLPTQRVRVVGLLEDTGARQFSASSVLAAAADVRAWGAGALDVPGAGSGGSAAAAGAVAGAADFSDLLVVARPGTSPQALRDRIGSALSSRRATVRTADEQSRAAVDQVARGTHVLAGIVGAFAVLALFVAGTVITNTFAVLVAQRTRALALLRCVGATRGQVRASVLVEALVLGVLASAVGAAAGTALAAGVAAVLHRVAPGIPVPATVHVGVASLGVPVLVGALVTVLAALAPAAAATRVSPLAALRPSAPPDLRSPGSRLRLAGALLLVVGGGAALAGGVAASAAGRSSVGLLLAVPGGAVSFTGVLVGSVFLVPRLVGLGGRLLGALLARTGAAATVRVAASNAVRNPRRTAATTSALLIGVTLVTLMTVGAASTEKTLDGALSDHYPVDVAVGGDDEGVADLSSGDRGSTDHLLAARDASTPRVSDQVASAVAAVPGVERAVVVRTAGVELVAGSRRWALTAQGVRPAPARAVLRSPSTTAALASGTLVVSDGLADELGVHSGQQVRLRTATGARALAVATGGADLTGPLLTAADLAALAPRARATAVWASLRPSADAARAVDRVQRASYERVIDTLLLVVVALLAVAVLIALIGVTNTLSLSVVERTRESAVLRAVGMTRRQLRGTLAVEGALITGVGGVLGIVLGTLYGATGAWALLGDDAGTGLRLALPWSRLALVVVVALAAGLLASVLPARRAAKASPVAALAE